MISVIIPAYNAENSIFRCVKSILKQTYQNFEIIITDDGSSDKTYECISTLRDVDGRIKIFRSENRGQGYQRNKMLSIAEGEYVLFLDSDDFLEPYTLELSINRIIEDDSDLVYFDWKYYFEETERLSYRNKEIFFGKKVLSGRDCLLLLSINPYFSVNRLYSKRFLDDNNIKYAEGHLYEDNPFIVATAFYAKKISIIHSPLYVVAVFGKSSTRNNVDTDIHYLGFLEAVRECKSILQQKPDELHYYYYHYAISRYFLYANTRTPKKYRGQFKREFVEILSDVDIMLREESDRTMKSLIACDAFKKEKYFLLELVRIYFKRFKPISKKIIRFIKTNAISVYTKNLIKKLIHKSVPIYYLAKYNGYLKKDIASNTVLFLGFDFKYTGNSRYLFESMIKNPGDKTIYFATYDKNVDEKYRVEPNSIEFYKLLATAKLLIFESWTVRGYKKREDAVWIQLWHGTPLKKMLFDSEETEIITKNKMHKIFKYDDILKWDYLICDNKNVSKYFETSFLVDDKKMLSCGYPRVKYLHDNLSNEDLKKKIKGNYGIELDKKIVVYLPTWRDYNYGEDVEDKGYLLDVDLLQDKLGNDYRVIDKEHSYLNKNAFANQNMETQELLLIADYLITDYSSVMFDAFSIDIPVIIYCNDFEKYQHSRGVYSSIWRDLETFTCLDIDGICDMISKYKLDSEYQIVKDKYCFCNHVEYLTHKIDNIVKTGDARKRIMLMWDSGLALDDENLSILKQSALLGDELYVIVDDNGNGEKNSLQILKEKLEDLDYVNAAIIKHNESLDAYLCEYFIDEIALPDTKKNRIGFENIYLDYEKAFICPDLKELL